MHYYVDGYNVLFKLRDSVEILQFERESLIEALDEKAEILGLDLTLVFDAHYQYGLGRRSHYQSLEICFTDEGESADDYIVNELRSTPNPREETVVTNDRLLAKRSRDKGAKTECVASFVSWLSKRYKKKLREAKKEGKELKKKVIVQKEEEKPKPRPKNPKPGKTPEESFDYYLDQFEKRLKEKFQN